MGRLFWKLFLAIFLAQLLTSWGMGILFWFERATHNSPATEFRVPPGMRPEPPSGMAPPQPAGQLAAPETPPGSGQFRPGPRPGGLPWAPLGIGMIASLIFATLLARHFSRPILGLRKAFSDVATGNFATRLGSKPSRWADELSDLGSDFDRTAAQLKMLIDNQRRLLHDVSHEVRSPLARMQLAIDLARQQPERAQESMQRLERESGRINQLVEELLTLSRLEAGACGSLDESVDLPELLRELVEDARFEAEGKHCKVSLGSEEHALVKGRGELLQRAIENVVRNAIRYSPEHSPIIIDLHCSGERVCIRVEDSGPGVAESALEAIFDPFVRLQDSRSNDGYGLGLAITRQTLEAHGGSVRACNREHGGLRVEMYLPLSR